MNVKKTIFSKLLNYSQKLLDKEYERNGLSDELLENQVRINEYRHKFNIPDPNQSLTEENFVQ